MSMIKKFNGKITVTSKPLYNSYYKDILSYAMNNYSHVNGVGQYKISINEWIENIKKVYNDNEPRTKEVIHVLLKL